MMNGFTRLSDTRLRSAGRCSPTLLAIVAACVALVGQSAWGQQPTTVQLPSFHSFSVTTSVIVPDSGSAYAGGVGRSSSGSTAFGPSTPGNRALGGNTSASGARVHATIHDLDGLDRQTLARASHSSPGVLPGQTARLAPRDALPRGGLAAARALHADEADNDVPGMEAFRHAEAAESQGKMGIARVYYSTAAKQATGKLRADALAGLKRASPKPQASLATR